MQFDWYEAYLQQKTRIKKKKKKINAKLCLAAISICLTRLHCNSTEKPVKKQDRKAGLHIINVTPTLILRSSQAPAAPAENNGVSRIARATLTQ